MPSVNLLSGTTISELEATLILCEKLLKKELSSGKKGIILSKGNPNEIKLSYKHAVEVLDSIDKNFKYKGCMSFGICGTCEKFDTKKFTDGEFGYCNGTMKHKYDTCQNHSKLGGGFGL